MEISSRAELLERLGKLEQILDGHRHSEPQNRNKTERGFETIETRLRNKIRSKVDSFPDDFVAGRDQELKTCLYRYIFFSTRHTEPEFSAQPIARLIIN